MRKEVVWAIIAGIIFGLVVGFGFWRVNSTMSPKGTKTESTPIPDSKKNQEFKITLDKPENEDVVTEDTITVTGITKPLTWITVSGEDSDYIIQSDERGNFQEEVDLVSGVNQIKITAFDPSGNESIEKVLVVYSSSFKKANVDTATPTDASDESSIRQKVEAKVKEALLKPKAYLGSVTDITDSTVQIKSVEGEIKQISVGSEDISVIKTGKTSKEVKLTDIAIGDFIVAMGYKNGNQVLSAQRILITDPVTEPTLTTLFGRVSNSNSKNLTLTELGSGKETEIAVAKSTLTLVFKEGKVTKTKFTGIEDDSNIIVVMQKDDKEKDYPRTIFVVSSS